MRKLVSYLIPAALVLVSAGCSRLEPENPEIKPVEQEEILIQKSFLAEIVETRTTLDGVEVLFSKDESLSVWDEFENQEFKADEAGRSVSFTGYVSPSATSFYALSPYSASTVFSKNGSTVTARTTLASVQTATPGSFADGANISAAQSDSKDSFSLQNVLSVVKFTLASANLDGHQIASVELSSTYPLAGDVVITYGETVTAAVVEDANTVNTVKLAKADGSALADGTYYLTLLPNAGGQITLKFTATDGYTASKTATLNTGFEAGTIKNLGTVKGLHWEEPKYYFMPVSEMVEGTYLIVSNNSGALLAAKPVVPASGNDYGYPKNDDVTDRVDNNGFIVMDDLSDAFVMSKNGSYYTIQQSDNMYWYQSGTYTSISIAASVSNNSNYSITRNTDGTFKILNNTTQRYLQYSTGYETFGSYPSATGIVPTLYRLVDPVTVEASVTLTTLDASGITGSSAVLNASYSGLFPINAVNVGFLYGTSQSALNREAYSEGPFTTTSGSFSVEIASLAENTTYYYRARMQVYDLATKTYKEFFGEIMSFKTGTNVPVTGLGWLELPKITGTEDYYGRFYSSGSSGKNRNYSYNYSYSWYASLWVAYPLTKAHTQGEQSSNWAFNPDIDEDYQVHIVNKSYPTNYGASEYSRGHQIPNADRKSNGTMNKQTYYATNQTPQLQNKFNGSLWGSLETAVRNLTNNIDTVYVVTGPVYRTVGGNEEISYLNAKTNLSYVVTPSSVPIPNYYWKALLKVRRNSLGEVTSASAIGFWYEHKNYVDGENFYDDNFIISVKDIEDRTGLDLFVNLPGDKNSGLEKTAQENTSWSAFQSF